MFSGSLLQERVLQNITLFIVAFFIGRRLGGSLGAASGCASRAQYFRRFKNFRPRDPRLADYRPTWPPSFLVKNRTMRLMLFFGKKHLEMLNYFPSYRLRLLYVRNKFEKKQFNTQLFKFFHLVAYLVRRTHTP